MDAALELTRNVMGAGVCFVGFIFIAGGVLGLLRFPDFYTRLHGWRAGESVGAVLVCLGLALLARDGAVALRLVMLAVLVGAIGPLTAQLVANAAHVGGLAPLAGRYTAPRPGAKSAEDDR